MDKKYILAFDQGTSSSRAILFNKDMKIVAIEKSEIKQMYPQPGWVEQNPYEILETQYLTAKTLFTKHKINTLQVSAIGITNQRETTIVWDKISGEPIYNAIVWQDKRTFNFCNELKQQGYEQEIIQKTGLVVDPYFSGTKLKWILDNIEGVRQRAEAGELLFGTVDTWLIWNLTGGKSHVTDFSNASRTMLFNINTLVWDKELLKLFNIPESILPTVCNSSEVVGETISGLFGKEPILISGIAGDQQAALFGQGCYNAGEAKNTYGTGCFMLMNTGRKEIRSKSGLLTTIAWGLNNEITYALEGSVFIAGAAIKWLRDGLKIIKSANETQAIAESISSNEGVYFVPAFAGLGAPYWNMYARGAIFGLTQGVTEKHIVRAALESLAYQTRDILDAMAIDSQINLQTLNVDGSASENDFLMQFQSDILNSPVIRPQITETTALGAALLAGLAVGFWTKDEIIEKRLVQKIFNPQMKDSKREMLYNEWKNAVNRCLIS